MDSCTLTLWADLFHVKEYLVYFIFTLYYFFYTNAFIDAFSVDPDLTDVAFWTKNCCLHNSHYFKGHLCL